VEEGTGRSASAVAGCHGFVAILHAVRSNRPPQLKNSLFGVAFSASVDVNVLNVPVPSFHAKPLCPCHRRPPQR
jgi:hypothetical protein